MTDTSPKDAVIFLMKGAAPERKAEIADLWRRYPVDVVLLPDAERVTLNANGRRIAFDAKTMDVFWLVGFSGWKAIECYSPLVTASVASGRTIAETLRSDPDLGEVERAYKERLAAARAFIETRDVGAAPWPPDIPRPSANRNELDDPQYKVAFDLSCIAGSFAFFHEFRHVMLESRRRATQGRARGGDRVRRLGARFHDGSDCTLRRGSRPRLPRGSLQAVHGSRVGRADPSRDNAGLGPWRQ